MSKNGGTSTVYWFRKCLRLHDNPALLASVAGNCRDFRAVFVLDPWIPQNQRVGIHRWRFLIQSLHDLDNSLQNLGSRLFVIKGNPSEVFPKLFKEWNVSHLAFEVDTEPYSLKRDAEITKIAKENGVEVIQKVSHTLYDVEKIIAMNNGRPPLTYQRFLTIMADIGPPTKPSPNFTKDHLANCQTVIDDDHELKYGIPTFEDLGKDPVTAGPNLYPGGEKEAVKRMDHYLSNSVWVCKFSKPNSSPNSLDPSTTVLSPYLKFGCLSSRTFYYRLQDIYKKAKGVHTKPPVSLLGQLYWREFYYVAAAGTPNFDRMEGNPICKQIPWEYNKEYLEAWTNAKTGYPFIDAIMTQLRQEGWIHHLARHAVACFLTRGDLWVSWEEGQKVFEEFLLDADWALNAGNWMWLSASAFFHQYYRVYSPVAFGKKTDKSGEYIRKYLPILKKIPDEYIYEPWKAPLSMQQKANCVIGKDYPAPIVDHDEARAQNLKKMEAAYKANKNNGEEDDDGHNTEGEGESIITNTSPTKRKRKQESPSRIDSPLKKMTQKRIYEFKSK